MTDNVRQRLSFNSFDEVSADAVTPEQERPEASRSSGYTTSHYQTRSQQKVVESIEATICANYLATNDVIDIEKEAHEQRVRELEQILAEEKKNDWMFGNKSIYDVDVKK